MADKLEINAQFVVELRRIQATCGNASVPGSSPGMMSHVQYMQKSLCEAYHALRVVNEFLAAHPEIVKK